jgi:hypothetical protein
MKHPNSNIQAPEKHQTSNSRAAGLDASHPDEQLMIVAWGFSGGWSLEFGAF